MPARPETAGCETADLPERLAAAATWPARFHLLNRLLANRLGMPAAASAPAVPSGAAAGSGTARSAAGGVCGPPGPERTESDLAMAAWRRLHRAGGRMRIGELAAQLGVARRGLEREVRDSFGLSPGALSRIARFQRAVQLIGDGMALAQVAAVGGYADQPHLTRDTRTMAGVTPGELRAFVHHRPPATAGVPGDRGR